MSLKIKILIIPRMHWKKQQVSNLRVFSETPLMGCQVCIFSFEQLSVKQVDRWWGSSGCGRNSTKGPTVCTEFNTSPCHLCRSDIRYDISIPDKHRRYRPCIHLSIYWSHQKQARMAKVVSRKRTFTSISTLFLPNCQHFAYICLSHTTFTHGWLFS